MSTLTSGTYPRHTPIFSARGAARPRAPHWLSLLWQGLHRLGQARARGHLLQLARQHEAVNPTLAAHLRAAAEDTLKG
ncbi:MAG: hypothetical protein RIQ53_4782 [Pseudomonadota bacterium]|jgi:hypothetical protein